MNVGSQKGGNMFFDFSGRMNRKQYFFAILPILVALYFFWAEYVSQGDDTYLLLIYGLNFLALPLMIKRLHDFS